MAANYTVDRQANRVTVYAVTRLSNGALVGVDLDESDLIQMLAQLQGNDAYTPDPRTGEL